MRGLEKATLFLLNLSLLFGIVALVANNWLHEEHFTAGLFRKCDEICRDYTSEIAQAVAALLIIAAIGFLVSSILLFVGLRRQKKREQKIGLTFLLVSTLFYVIGCCLFTTKPPFQRQWGFSFVLAWLTVSSAITTCILAVVVFMKGGEGSLEPTIATRYKNERTPIHQTYVEHFV
ncbi:unnamed protein product [Clavelina lepadiformis]|uniref:Uncharacterized protein n=1 Tax=Clavelina lepadiformis TaxID=159417 RepID=A0ABP0EXU7_CLALP